MAANKQKNMQKVFTRKEEDLQLKNKLLLGPELLITNKGADDSLEKLALKIKLRSGVELLLSDYVIDRVNEYSAKFPKLFFYEIARLKSIDPKLMDQYHKPVCVPKFINDFIYGRFPYKVLKMLRNKNPYLPFTWIRGNKHFQFLSEEASDQLDLYISQAIVIMKSCDDMTEFKLKYSKEYQVYAQLDLLEDAAVNS